MKTTAPMYNKCKLSSCVTLASEASKAPRERENANKIYDMQYQNVTGEKNYEINYSKSQVLLVFCFVRYNDAFLSHSLEKFN